MANSIICKETDGYVNVSYLNKSRNKRFTDWRKGKAAKIFIEDLSRTLGIPINGTYGSGALIEYDRKLGNRAIVFLHPRLAEKYEGYLLTDVSKPSIVYLIHAEKSRFYKIGVTSDVKSRLNNLQTANPLRLYILSTCIPQDAYRLEYQLHSHFRAKKAMGEWFKLANSDIQYILDAFTKSENEENFDTDVA